MDIVTDTTSHGVREQVGTIVGSHGVIPLALWTPEGVKSDRLVMIGHGASGHKMEEYVLATARRFVRKHHCAVVAIDGPVHGDRVGGSFDMTTNFLQFAQRWSSDLTMTDVMASEWSATLDAVLDSGALGDDVHVAYWGLSMGTIFGLPFVASEPRIEAAVLGLMGTTGPTHQRLADDAQRLRVPVLFLIQWDDELIDRDLALNLFTQIGSSDKTLLATPGAHSQVTAENFQRTIEFLMDRLSKVAEVAK
jgi:pimeloyl-ACP methyl ester carboxylesterase